MRRRPITASSHQRLSNNWGDRVWSNIPGLNTWAVGLCEFTSNGIPNLIRCGVVPASLFPWEEKSKYKGHGAIHFYCEDVYLSGIWNSAKRYPVPAVVRRAGVALTPDYSVFTDWPAALNQWQVYRARLLGSIWSTHGIAVIPSLMWGETSQYSYLFDGLPTGGTFAISTGHTKGDEDVFKAFYVEALKRCQPELMLVYGQGLKPWIEMQSCPVKRYAHRRDKISAAYKQAAKRS